MFTLATIDGIHNNSQTNRYKPKYLCLCMLLPSRSAKLIYSSVNAHVNIPISLKTFKHFISLKKKCNDLREKKLTALIDNYRCALDFDKLEQASAVPVRGKQLINLLDC